MSMKTTYMNKIGSLLMLHRIGTKICTHITIKAAEIHNRRSEELIIILYTSQKLVQEY